MRPDGAAAGRQRVALHVRGDRTQRTHPLRPGRRQGRRPRRLRGDRRGARERRRVQRPVRLLQARGSPSSTGARSRRWSAPARWMRSARNRAVADAAAAGSAQGDRAAGARTRGGPGVIVRRAPRAPSRKCTSTCRETDDWPLLQKLQGERDTLGHYLSGHPLDPLPRRTARRWSATTSATSTASGASVRKTSATAGARKRPSSSRDRSRRCASAATARPSCSWRTDAGASSARSSPRPTTSSRTCSRATASSWSKAACARTNSAAASRCAPAAAGITCRSARQHAQKLSVKLDLRERDALGQFAAGPAGAHRQHAAAARGDHRRRRRPAEHQRRPGRAR